MKRFWLCLGIALCVMGGGIARAENHEEVPEHKELQVLERNIKIEFKAVPLEKGDKGTYIVTAFPEFETGIRLEGPDGKIHFVVSGEVNLLEDGKIFVRFEAHTILREKKGEAEFNVRSGVILNPGEELGVSRMGDKTFMIRASYVDSKASSK